MPPVRRRFAPTLLVTSLLAPSLLVTSLVAPAGALQKPSDSSASEVDRISQRLDRMYRSNFSHSRVRMRIKTPHYERELAMEMWTRNLDDTLVRIRSPRKERGTSTLKKGREMWNYLPKIKKTIRVPPSLMMSSWMGSDFTNDDMVRESSWQDDYSASMEKTPPAGQKCLDYRAKPSAPVAWARVQVCVDAERYTPIRQTFYDEKGRKARVMDFSDVKEFSGRWVPAKMTLTPLSPDKKGNQTVVMYDELSFDEPLDDTVFSLTHLRRGR